MPPREGRSEREKMYEVVQHFESEADLKHFLHTTKKFSKRFYNITGHSGIGVGDKPYFILHITAIAISRDLTYILKMAIRCDKVYESTDHDEVQAQKQPEFGWIPKNEDTRNLYFPDISLGYYGNVFAYNGFHKIGSIRKDGVDLLV